VRFKNFSPDTIRVPIQLWTRKETQEFIGLSVTIESGEITDDFDPNDPIVRLMLKAHPELRPVVMANAWERLLAGVL
jgi:hypothetical protein